MIEIRTTIDRDTLEETAESVTGDFPYRGNRDILEARGVGLCPWHWHNEVELFYIEKGSLRYTLPGVVRDFAPGDVGFVNANVLHMTQCLGPVRCEQQEHIFLPRLVAGTPGGAIERRYVLPLLQNKEAELLHIPADHPRAEALRRAMDRAFEAFQRQEAGFELRIRAELGALWLALLEMAPQAAGRRGGADDERVKAMLRCIEANYGERLTLADIAAAASVSPREATRCFRRRLGTTPVEYLLDYRVDRAAELLRGGERSVTEIALGCGFATSSYFGKVFRQRMGASPLAYRKGRAQA